MTKNKKTISLLRASKGRGFVEPRYSPFIQKFVSIVGPLYLKKVEGVKSVKIENIDFLFDALKEHYNKERTLIIAFRHVEKQDAPVLTYVLNTALTKRIKNYNKTVEKEKRIIGHAQFLYGSDVLEWAGSLAAFIFPRLGGIPVINRSNNSKALNLLKTTMKAGLFPVALAPESQVTYHMARVFETSSGISSLAVWAEEGGKEVTILPIAFGYNYDKDAEIFINSCIKRWREETAIDVADNISLYEKLIFITQETIKILESFYSIEENIDYSLKERIDHICHISMNTGEHIAHVRGSGSLLDRLFSIRHAGISALKPDDFERDKKSSINSSIADFTALHAHIFLWHSQIVDVLEYIDPSYITPPCSFGRLSEYILNILDVLNRIKGGNIDSRYTPKTKEACVYVGEKIEIQRDAHLTRKDKRKVIENGVKEALQKASSDVETHYFKETYTLF